MLPSAKRQTAVGEIYRTYYYTSFWSIEMTTAEKRNMWPTVRGLLYPLTAHSDSPQLEERLINSD